jgi:alpha,alpha-trehalase
VVPLGHTGGATESQEEELANDSLRKLREHCARLRPNVVRPAKGFLKHDYLVPGGFYEEQWDWDGFFIALHWATRRPPRADLMRNWALNFIGAADENGTVPGCLTPNGPEKGHRAFQMKPFLAQGICIASKVLGVFDWVAPHYDTVVKIARRRAETQFDADYGLFFWFNGVQSGADNNPALTNDASDRNAIIACDANTYEVGEYRALARIGAELGRTGDAARFRHRADELVETMNRVLWNAEDETYYNVRRDSGDLLRRVTYSNFVPLVQRIAKPDDARAMIERTLWNEDHMLTPYGVRSLSKQDADYNNVNMLFPYSNWQGPVWPIANYLYFRGLMNYGFLDEARELARRITALLVGDLERFGSMHENYDAETGAPLAPSGNQSPRGEMEAGFIGWNLLAENIWEELDSGADPLSVE